MKPPPTIAEFMRLPEAEMRALLAEKLSQMSDREVATSVLGVLTKLVAMDLPAERILGDLTTIMHDVRAGERLRLKRSQ